jgi:anti-anti-sigma factor
MRFNVVGHNPVSCILAAGSADQRLLRKEVAMSVTSVEHLPQAVVVHVLAGSLGKSEVNGLCSGVDEARVTAPSLPLILDMAKVNFMPSQALGVLVGLNQEFRNRSQRLIFVSLQANVRQAITVTRISSMMEIISDVSTALQSVGGNS